MSSSTPRPAAAAPPTAEERPDRVLRHPLAVRLTHWLMAGSGLVLLFTGFGELPMYKRYNVIKLPGLGWAADFELNLVLHYLASVVFVAAAVFHLVYHLRRRELAALPRRGDLGESVAIVKAMVRGKKEPPHGKFLAEQRLAYAALAGTAGVLILSGLVKTYKNMGDVTLAPWLLQAITLLHTAAGMAFMGLVLAHLGAFALRANWPLLPSMVTGYVRRRYAKERHPLWDIDGDGGDLPGPHPPAARPPMTTKEILRLVPGVMVLAGAALAAWVTPWGLALLGFVGLNLLQSAFTRWCLLETLLKRAGVADECGPDAVAPRRVTTRDLLRLVPGLMLLAGVILAAFGSAWGLALLGFVGLNLLQSAFTRWCLLESLLRRAGVPEPCHGVSPNMVK